MKFYFLQFWLVLAKRAFSIIRSRKKETIRARKLLRKIELQFKGEFNKETFNKVVVSHAIYSPMICNAFTRLHDRICTTAENERMIHYFICSSLFDNFFDLNQLSEKEIEAITFDTEKFQPKNFDEKAGTHCHRMLLNYLSDKASYMVVLKKVYESQAASKEQFNPEISEERIREITFGKGANSVLLCRYYLDLPQSAAEDNCWLQIGKIIQLTNDVYDIHKDLQDGIHTLATRIIDINKFEKFFLEQISLMKKYISNLSFSNQKKEEFSMNMAGIYAFGLICIEQLKKLQNSETKELNFSLAKRSDLIIDMEKPGNILQWLKLVYRHSRLN